MRAAEAPTGFAIDPPIEPMLAKVSDVLPEGAGWLFEPKWDGFRALVGHPVPAVTSTCSTPGTWLHDVPRIWRTASVMPFMPWM